MVFPAQVAETPGGKPFAPATPLFVIPVALEVVWVKLVKAVLMQTGLIAGAGVTVLIDEIVIVPLATTVPHPPVNGIV